MRFFFFFFLSILRKNKYKCSVPVYEDLTSCTRSPYTPPVRQNAAQGLKVCKEETGNAYVIMRRTWRMTNSYSYNLTNIKILIGQDKKSNVE